MNLLMLTKFYPYGTGEAFIENEINIFSKYFDKITIIACEVPKSENRVRSIPSNVKAFRVDARDKRIDALKGVIKQSLSKKKEIKEELLYCKGFKRKIFLYYFEEKSQRVYREILKKDFLNGIIDEPFMLYSYWLFMTARVGLLISEDRVPVYKFTRTHRYDLYEERNKLNYLPLRRNLLNGYDSIFPCSDNGSEYLKEKYPKYSEKIHSAFLGTLDHGCGKSSDDGFFRLVSCSRIAPEKRVEKIVDALKIIDFRKQKIEWHHIGDGEGLERIKSECANLHNIKCVFYGNVPNADVLKKYRELPFDLFLNVSSSEGLPVSIMEAISFGMPVIATDVGGTNEIVFDGLTGKLLEENFEDITLADEIVKFVNMNKEEYQTYRKNCRNKWEASFQAIPNYKKLCQLLTREIDYENDDLI